MIPSLPEAKALAEVVLTTVLLACLFVWTARTALVASDARNRRRR